MNKSTVLSAIRWCRKTGTAMTVRPGESGGAGDVDLGMEPGVGPVVEDQVVVADLDAGQPTAAPPQAR